MKIKMHLEIDENTNRGRTDTFELSNLGYTESEWNKLTEEKKQDIVWDEMVHYVSTGFEEVG